MAETMCLALTQKVTGIRRPILDISIWEHDKKMFS